MTDTDSIADQIIDGDICAQCHCPIDGDAPESLCIGCAGFVETDYKQVKRDRGEQAFRDFPSAAKLAREHGFRLIRNSDVHYAIVGPNWRVELYPTKCRVYKHPTQTNAPFLKVPLGRWTLMDVVKAAIVASQPGANGP